MRLAARDWFMKVSQTRMKSKVGPRQSPRSLGSELGCWSQKRMPLPGRDEASEMDARSQKWTQVQGWDEGPEVDSWAKIGCSARGRIDKYDE